QDWLDVDAALGFGEPGPAACPQVLAGASAARAGLAADAGVALIKQRVVGYLVSVDIAPHVALGPIGQRVDFQEVVARAPLHQLGSGAGGGLVAADSADPGAVGTQRISQRSHLANAAAAVGVALVQAGALLDLLLRQRQDRLASLDRHAIAAR